jgi:hypothetical protein
MWVFAKVRLILVAHGRLLTPPHGWKLTRRRIPHVRVGGVTNIIGHIGIYCRSDNVEPAAIMTKGAESARPRRDLQSVLKMAVMGGHRCQSPSSSRYLAGSIGQDVKEVRTGIVLNCGLLGVKTNGELLCLPRVKNLFGGDMWVIRALTPAEVLVCWGVPEKLGHLTRTEEAKRESTRGIFTPIKIWQSCPGRPRATDDWNSDSIAK